MLEEQRLALLSLMDKEALWPADSPWIREAMQTLPRHRFAPDIVWDWSGEQYEAVRRIDMPQAWGAAVYPGAYGSTVTQVTDGLPTSSISCTAIVATMLDSLILDREAQNRVLELGAGTGWNASLLAEQAMEVISVEFDAGLAASARQRIEEAGRRAHVVTGDGDAGWPDGAPFDRVIATYSVEDVPWAWVEQTRPGGRIVAPWGHTGCVALTVAPDGGSAAGWMQALAQFMPARGTTPRAPFERVRGDQPGTPVAFPRPVRGLADPDVLFALRVLLPEVQIDTRFGTGVGRAWLSDGVSSWCTLDEGSSAAVKARQGGVRDLAAEVVRAWQEWEQRGAPGMFDFGLLVTPDAPPHVFTGDDPRSRGWVPLVPACGDEARRA